MTHADLEALADRVDDAALKMARECYVEYMHKCAEKAGDTVAQASVDRLLSGQDDHMHGVQIALAMHARMKAEVDALVHDIAGAQKAANYEADLACRMQVEVERKDALLRRANAIFAVLVTPDMSVSATTVYAQCREARAAINKELGQ